MADAQTEARAIVRSASPTVRKLFDAIRESGSSEPDIADAAGVSHATLHYWRAGNRSPTIMLLEAVASVLGYNIELVKADHATALAAKDAELAILRAELNDCASEIHDLRAQIERAEVQLAEANRKIAERDKALANYDRWLNGRDAYIVQKGLWQNFVASLPGSPTARRALKAENERLEIAKREAIAGWKDAERALAERARGVKGEWHRADGDKSILLYTLRQDGWRKGEAVMVNDVTVRIEAANGSESPIEPIASAILSTLTTEPAAPEGR